MPRTRVNLSTGINIPTAAETVVATIVIPSAPAGAPIDFDAIVQVASSATAGNINLRIERGSVAGATPLIALVSIGMTASTSYCVSILGTDVQAVDIANQPYVLTLQQTTGTTYVCSVEAIQAVW